MKPIAAAALLALSACASAPAAAPLASTDYKVIRHITLGGEGGWDYLTSDPANHQLFVSRANRVIVVDTTTGKVKGEIEKTEGVHGIALAPKLHRGFTSNGRTSTVTVFDPEKLQFLTEIRTGERPDAILYEPVTQQVFTFNAGSRDATAIDADLGKIAGTIPLGAKPEFGVTDGRGNVYVNLEDTGEVAAIDARHRKVTRRWKLDGCEEPTGLAIDTAHDRLFSGCSNKVMAISDARAGRMVATAPIGAGVDGVVFDPSYGVAISANGADGTISVVAERDGRFQVVQTLATVRGARTITLDEKTHHLFLPTAQFGPAPAPSEENPHPRPAVLPNTFEVVEVGR